MLNELTQEQINELFKKLPEDLQNAVYAEETAENIREICKRNNISEFFDFLVDRVLSVYLGILPLDKFWKEIEQRFNEKTGIKQTVYEIDHFLIAPYRESIEKLYSPAEVETSSAKTIPPSPPGPTPDTQQIPNN